MLQPRFAVGVFWAGMMVLSAGVASGQNYPVKPVRMVTGEVGGANDFVARLIAQGISSRLGQNVIVENRPSTVVGEIVSKALPDGYTLLSAGPTFTLGALLQKLSYDPVADFLPVSLVSTEISILVVHPSLPVKSVRELIALAKARPGELNYASTGSGGVIHLAAELFNAMAGVNIVRVPYKGGGPALNALLGAQVQLMFPSAGGAVPHVKSGRLRALAVTSAQPSALFPGLPTVAASGLPGYEAVTMYGVYAPAKTRATIINRLNQEIVRVLHTADVKERFFNRGAETAPGSPEQFAAALKSEMIKWGKVIKDAGIKAD